MKKRRLKAFAFGAALVFFAALLPVTALAVEEEEELPVSSGGLEDDFYEDAAEDKISGALPEFGAPEDGNPAEPGLKPETPEDCSPGDPAPKPELPEGGVESGGSAGSAPEPEKPENGAGGGAPAESAPEPKPPEDGEKEDGSAGPAPELPGEEEPPENIMDPETPEGGEGTGGPLEKPPAEIVEVPPEEPAAPVAVLSADTQGRITLDGSLEDWAMVPGMAHGNPKIDSWKAARDLEGNVYICFTGTAETPYDTPYKWNPIVVTQDGVTRQAAQDDLALVFPGAEMAVENLANGQSAAPYYVEMMIPAAHVSGEGCVLSLGGAGQPVPVSSLPVLDGQELPKEEPVYRGIVIDGDFSDRDAVGKVPIRDSNPINNNLESTAFIFDGDLYIYIEETPGGDAAAAGSHSTGNYVITTDLGRALKFQLKKEDGGSVYGVEGAEARHVGMQWEVRIPAGELPYYQKTVSFGLYLEEPTISGVSNLQGGGGTAGSFTGIEIDGAYDDWIAYPHSIIEYATPGSQAEDTDSQGALYFEDGTLYGHVATTMPEHLDSWGGDFLANIDIAFNGDREFKGFFEEGNFYPHMITEDGRDVNEFTRLEPGVHTFLICDRRTLGDPEKPIFGTMKVTIDENRIRDEMEFDLDLKAIAECQGCTVNDLRTIEARFGRFGDWITISGASSGALLGVTLCCGMTAGVLFRRKKRGGAA